MLRPTLYLLIILIIVKLQADRGCAVGANVLGGGGSGRFGMGVTLHVLRISEKKEILRKLILL